MNYWQIIAANLSKAGWSWAAYQRLIPKGERSGLQTRIAKTESISLRERMKSLTAFLELEISNQRLRLIRRKMMKEKTNENNN